MDCKDLTSKTKSELLAFRSDLKKEQFQLRIQLKMSQLSNTSLICQNRRNYARVLTQIRQLSRKGL